MATKWLLDSKEEHEKQHKEKKDTKKLCIGPQKEHTKNFHCVNRRGKRILTGLLKENTFNNAESDVEIFQQYFFRISLFLFLAVYRAHSQDFWQLTVSLS
jgi:hypothetical protein